MGQSNGKKAKKKEKIDYSKPPKLKRASTTVFKTGVKKMGDMRKVLDSDVYNINMQTEVCCFSRFEC